MGIDVLPSFSNLLVASPLRLPERDHRIDRGGAAGGDPPGRERGRDEQGRKEDEDAGVGGCDAEEPGLNESSEREGQRDAERRRQPR